MIMKDTVAFVAVVLRTFGTFIVDKESDGALSNLSCNFKLIKVGVARGNIKRCILLKLQI